MERSKVLWCGSRDGRDGLAEYRNRGLSLEVLNGHPPTSDQLRAARGIVYCFGENGVVVTRQLAESTIQPALDHGLAVLSIARTDPILSHVQREMKDLGVPDVVVHRIEDREPVPDDEIAQLMLMADPKMSWSGALEIEPVGDCELSGADELLLRRAFSDCKRIRLSPLTGGRTAEAFMVEATLKGSCVGPRPLPFFAKLGPRHKIKCERDRYRDFAANFIPFYLRPNLDPSRCLLGFERGILIGNFVDRAEPLWKIVETRNAGRVIRSLFDHTLGGWRAQGFEEPHRKKSAAVAGGLNNIFDYKRVRAEHLAAALSLGLSREPRELWELLIERPERYYEAPMHGDLHPGNVFVRQADAILIDLASVEQGPLSADPACLETSLMFERRASDQEGHKDEWRRVVDQLYAPSAFSCSSVNLAAAGIAAHRWKAAREVRRIGLGKQACPTEYESAVAVYLLRRAMYPADDRIDAFRRAYALVTAERLILSKEGPRD